MDILTHTVTGLAAGTCMAAFSLQGWKEKTMIILFSGLGGALPDIDAISLWSGFDATIGKLLGLEHPGRHIYSAKLWYSHHGFMHSVLAAVLIAGLIGLLFYIAGGHRKSSLWQTITAKKWLLAGFLSGYLLHLFQDMITPAGPWGGVRFFFPAETYIGGTGQLWWWNNYNLFLVVLAVFLFNMIILLILPRKIKKGKYTSAVFLIGIVCFLSGIKQINHNFNGGKYPDHEKKSKEIQQQILPDNVYTQMQKLDNSLKIHF